VPEVLLGGNHGAIARWRHEQRLERTAARRPDLLHVAATTEELAGLEHSVATRADAPELTVLQKACWIEMVTPPELWRGAPAEDAVTVAEGLRHWTTHLFRAGDRLVGSVRVRRDPRDPTTWQIGRLMVVPDLQGRGLGRALLAHAEALAPTDTSTLWLDAGADQPRLLRFCTKAGYRVVGPGEEPGTVDLRRPRRR
jgi:tRNA (guanine37-N1)-methyltransferase